MAVLYAKEGANVTIVYLPEEEEDAKETKRMVEKEGMQCLLIAGNLMDSKTCENAVAKHVETWGFKRRSDKGQLISWQLQRT